MGGGSGIVDTYLSFSSILHRYTTRAFGGLMARAAKLSIVEVRFLSFLNTHRPAVDANDFFNLLLLRPNISSKSVKSLQWISTFPESTSIESSPLQPKNKSKSPCFKKS